MALLEDRGEDAVGGADRQQVHERGLQRRDHRAERDQQQQHAQADDDRDDQRQPLADQVGEVEQLGGRAADVGVDAARRDDRVAHLVDERRSWRPSVGEPSGMTLIIAAVPSLETCGSPTAGDALGRRRAPRGACGRARPCRRCRRSTSSGAVGARRRSSRSSGRRPGATWSTCARARLVREPEPERRTGARERRAAAATDTRANTPGRRARRAPQRSQKRAVAERRALVAADAQPLDAVAAEAEQRRQQRHRGEHGDDDDDRGGLAEHGDQRDAGHRQRQQRDDDGDAGERDRAARGRGGVADRVVRRSCPRGGPSGRG